MSEISKLAQAAITIGISTIVLDNITSENLQKKQTKFYMVQFITYDDDYKNVVHTYEKPVKKNNTKDVFKYLKKCVIKAMDDLEIWDRYCTEKEKKQIKKQMNDCKTSGELYDFVNSEMKGQFADRLIGWDVYVIVKLSNYNIYSF